MKVLIESDGTAAGTSVIDEQGNYIVVEKIIWGVSVSNPEPKCVIEILKTPKNEAV